MENKIKFPYIFLSAVIFISLHLIFLKTKLYGNRGWVDILLHFITGVFLGAIFLWWCNRKSLILSPKSLVISLLVSGLVGGLIWESVEFTLWNFLPKIGDYVEIKKTPLRDTFSDLSLDTLGSLSWLVFVKIRKNGGQK